MQTVNLTVNLTLQVPNEDQATQILVVQELLDKLYVGAEYYKDDIFNVSELQLKSFELQ